MNLASTRIERCIFFGRNIEKDLHVGDIEGIFKIRFALIVISRVSGAPKNAPLVFEKKSNWEEDGDGTSFAIPFQTCIEGIA